MRPRYPAGHEGLIAYQYNKMGTSLVQVIMPAVRDVKKSRKRVFFQETNREQIIWWI